MATLSGYEGSVLIPILGIKATTADFFDTELTEWTVTHSIENAEVVVKKQASAELITFGKDWEASVSFLFADDFLDLGGLVLLAFDGTDITCSFILTGAKKASGKAQIDDFELSNPIDGPVLMTLHVIGTNSDDLGLVFV